MNGARVGTLQIGRARAAVSLPPLRTPATIVRPDLIASDMATYLIPCCPLQTLLLSSASAKASRILPAVSDAAAQSNNATHSRGAVLYPLSPHLPVTCDCSGAKCRPYRTRKFHPEEAEAM